MNLKHIGCKFEGCKNKHRSGGYCQYHWNQFYNERKLTPQKVKKKCCIDGCNKNHRAKGYCSAHYWEIYNKTQKRRKELNEIQRKYYRSEKGKLASKKYNESELGSVKIKNRNKKRRAILKGVVVEDFLYTDIYKRDFYICSICGLPIDASLKHPDPNSVSLEHKIPLSKNGQHSLENCVASHFICNLRKNAKIIDYNFEGASI